MSRSHKENGIIPPSRLGYKHTEEARKKISRAGVGRYWNNKQKELLSKKLKGHKVTDETKNKLRSYRGELASGWKGGLTKIKYAIDWSRSLRIAIRERDKYTCQLCNERQGDRAFAVHHIDYDKLNSNPNNLITLCASCHSKTNSKRENWIKYFNQK